MALTVEASQLRHINAGQNGYMEVSGIFAFSTTDATGELSVGLIKQVQNVQLTPIGSALATDEALFVNETTSGGIIAQSSGAITINRTGASRTSGLKVAYRIVGIG